jgi:hypothetical protein
VDRNIPRTLELLAKVGDGDFPRNVAEAVRQLLMEAGAEGLIGAGWHERSGEQAAYRNRALDITPEQIATAAD